MFKEKYVRLLIAFTILFWISIFVRFYWNAYKNTNAFQLEKAMQASVLLKTKGVDNLLTATNPIEFESIKKQVSDDVYVYLFEHDTLIDWTSNALVPSLMHYFKGYKLQHLNNCYYFQKEIQLQKDKIICIAIPLNVSVSNGNSVSVRFLDNDYIPQNTVLSSRFIANGIPLLDHQKHILGYVHINQQSIATFQPQITDVLLVIVAVFFTFVSINIANLFYVKRKSQWRGFFFSVLNISFFRLLLYIFGIPFHAHELQFFSSELYYKNQFLPSLGDVFFNAIGFMWIVSYVYKHTDYKRAFLDFKSKLLKKALFVFCIFLVVFIYYVSIYLTSSLLLDSKISFNFKNFENITFYSFAVLVILCMIIGTSTLALNLLNYSINNLCVNKYLKYGIILLSFFVLRALLPNSLSRSDVFFINLWMILFYISLDFFKLKISSDISELASILWLIFICSSFTLLFTSLYKKNVQKNKHLLIEKLCVLNNANSLLEKKSTLAFNLDSFSKGYSIAYYSHNVLQSQNNNFPFPVYITPSSKKYQQVDKNNQEWIICALSNQQAVVLVSDLFHNYEGVFVFSYLFGISILIIFVIITYRLFISLLINKQYQEYIIVLNFKKRTHYALLLMVLVSFFLIAGVTIYYLYQRFKKNNETILSDISYKAKKEFTHFVFTKNITAPASSFCAVDSGLQKELVFLSEKYQTAICVYSPSGYFISSSISKNHTYSAPVISAVAKATVLKDTIGNRIIEEVVQGEKVLMSYFPIMDKHNKVLVYLSLSAFDSQKELKLQIIYFIFVLTNLYALIFVFSSVFTFIITSNLTKSFNQIIKQFQRVTLTENATITWPYEDEIGLMVSEYNKMVKKLEASAFQLAQSEREDAWKEMAMQVAHEIKNPLTPMRLNLQFLQNALKNKQSNIDALTDRVANSLIEQIDNLNYIASEFSNFAKLPDPKVEDFSLSSLVEKSVSIYSNESAIAISLTMPSDPVWVRSDKSQLLRVFTNILQNAVQAIPSDKKGIIDVLLTLDQDEATVQIKDNGIGIQHEIRNAVFVPHFTTKNSGSGIGLAMSKRIIEYWNGSIWFESTENKGTVFYIKLPILKQTIA